jgi:hypothetical protein
MTDEVLSMSEERRRSYLHWLETARALRSQRDRHGNLR